MKKKRFLIYLSIGLSLSTLLGVSFFYLSKLNALEKNNEQVGYSYQVIIQLSLLEKNLQNASISQRGYLLTGRSSFLESYLDELKDIPELLVTLQTLTNGDELQQRSLDTLGAAINRQLESLKANMSITESDTLSLTRFAEDDRQMDVIASVIAAMRAHEAATLSERSFTATQHTSESRRSSFLSLSLAFLLCCVAAFCIVWFFNRNENYRRQLEEKLAKLTLLNAEIQGLMMAGTHNLQEPMRKVQTIIDRLQHLNRLKDEELEAGLNRVRSIYARQQATNNTITDYYHILSQPLHLEPVDLHAVVHELLAEKKHSWPITVQMGQVAMLRADRQQMRWLFTHLLNNCVQFAHPARAAVVTIEPIASPPGELPAAHKTSDFYCVRVSDNGIGIDDDYREKIFGLFRKMEETPASAHQNGMGLSFCRRIMINHEGWIAARKNQQAGTSIYLFFQNSTRVWK